MIHLDPGRLLQMAGVLRHPCDLDLLVFFVRHPRVLLASESLASFLGYDMKLIARSLDGLLATGLLTRRQAVTHAARLYVFTGSTTDADWLFPLVQIASTPHGRRTLLTILNARPDVQEPDGRLTEFEYGRARKAAGPYGRAAGGGAAQRGDDDA